jgi:hypothetical protein
MGLVIFRFSFPVGLTAPGPLILQPEAKLSRSSGLREAPGYGDAMDASTLRDKIRQISRLRAVHDRKLLELLENLIRLTDRTGPTGPSPEASEHIAGRTPEVFGALSEATEILRLTFEGTEGSGNETLQRCSAVLSKAASEGSDPRAKPDLRKRSKGTIRKHSR